VALRQVVFLASEGSSAAQRAVSYAQQKLQRQQRVYGEHTARTARAFGSVTLGYGAKGDLSQLPKEGERSTFYLFTHL